MAVIPITSESGSRVYWETVTGSDTCAELVLPKGGVALAIQAIGTFGDTLTMQGTIDGVTWFSLITGPGGSAVTFTEAGYAEITTAVRAIRPSPGASITDVDVWARVVG